MIRSPFTHNMGSFGRKMPFEDQTGFDGNEGLATLIFGVEVRGRVVSMVPADVDAKKTGGDRHSFGNPHAE